ncbi:MAG: glycine--tRNA ligase [Chloroflexi bacterium]|nr:glycine--tRNA ligase [Chloroflexota bacterium]
MEKLVSLCKRRGYIFPGSDLYGGLNGTWDYGPLGVELKRNIKDAWWRAVVRERDDVVGLDAAILMHPQVWAASGHVAGFTDPMVDCKACQGRFRADHIEEDRCPACGAVGQFTEARQFNLMFKTFVGPVENEAAQVYLRPETAQGIFVNFQNVLASSRKRIPFGIAQIGKAFRNEINPRNFTYRSREFEQMELEFFCKPGTDEEWHQHWLQERFNWYLKLGMRRERLRLRQHAVDELSHYAKDTYDIEYLFPWGWGELEGIANRTDFDLKQHQQHSGKGLEYFDDETKEHYIPYVIEPSGGVDRTALAFLADAYAEDAAPDAKGKEEPRVVLRLHPALAPVKVAVLPLSRNEKLRPQSREVFDLCRRAGIAAEYDDAQSIGRRYRRQDEIGTPLCVTVDFQTVESDQQVTIRDRDSMQQVRVPIAGLVDALRERLGVD